MLPDREGLAQSEGEGEAAPVTGVNDSGSSPDPKPPRPSPPRYKKAEVDAQVLDLIRRLEPTDYRELGRETGYGMWVLTHSVARLREDGLVIPGVPGRRGFLVAVRSPK